MKKLNLELHSKWQMERNNLNTYNSKGLMPQNYERPLNSYKKKTHNSIETAIQERRSIGKNNEEMSYLINSKFKLLWNITSSFYEIPRKWTFLLTVDEKANKHDVFKR